ncbi:MAG: hypothetical protein K2G55_03595, partial [Lachnospiraceae bacterium]|nr:hypothetical protein [Lachnospiraceae bacterium]
MAGKRTGKKAGKRRRKRKNRNLNVFVKSLILVLVTGSLVMLGYSAVAKRLDARQEGIAEKTPKIVDFSGLGQQGDQSRQDRTTEGQSAATADEMAGELNTSEQPMSTEETVPTEDERLFNEAVQKG